MHFKNNPIVSAETHEQNASVFKKYGIKSLSCTV